MNNNLFNNKVAFVTGSTRGIGLSIAEKLSDYGAKVYINGRNENYFESALSRVKGAHLFKGDLSNAKEAKKTISKLTKHSKKIDILVCNVGSGKSVKPGEESHEEWKRMFDINFYSAVNTIHFLKDKLIESSGSIVCISSICATEIIEGAPLTYSCAKAALNHYVKGISKSLGRHGVRINVVSPGNIIFEDSSWERKLKANKVKVEEMISKNVPLSRFGTPDEIAELVCYLTSSKANFVTGSIWNIDGGQHH